MTAKKKEQSQSSGSSEENQTALNFEQQSLESALERLEEIVSEMDSESVELEHAIELFQEGMKLTKYCREQIAEAEQEVKKLVEDAEGEITLEEFDDE